MKKVLVLFMLVFTATSSYPLETMTFTEVLKAKSKEMKAIYSLTWITKNGESGYARHAGGAYLPINTLHSKDGKYDYADWGVGIEEPEGSEKPKIIVPFMGNVFAIARKVFSFRWAREHVRTTALPDVWFGPVWHPPTKLSVRGFKEYKIKENIGLAASVRFVGPWFLKAKEEAK